MPDVLATEIRVPKFFVKQPDGKFALFSSIVDDFTEWGLSDDEAVEVASGSLGVTADLMDDVIGKAQRDEPFWASTDRGDGANRWRQALVPMAAQHGIERIEERMLEMGIGEFEIPEEAIRAAEETQIARHLRN
jgi:hypothetical protein